MIRIGLVSGVLTGILLALTAPVLGPLFTSDDEVVRLLGHVLLAAAIAQPLAGVVFVLDGVLIGAGDQRIADTAAGWLFWFALGSAAVTIVVWSLVGLPDSGVVRTITVLVIACPHALGLAIPLVVSIATERAARGGVLVKDRLALESMRTVDTVLFDKTGTLTKGEPTVTSLAPVGGITAAVSKRVLQAGQIMTVIV